MIPSADQLIGHVLGGFRLVERIGTGGAAAVFRAVLDKPPFDEVAVKVLLPPAMVTMSARDMAEFRERFTREAATVGRHLRHPHILPVLDAGEDTTSGLAYMVMPLMRGGTLETLTYTGPLAFADVARYVTDVASALDYAHSRGIVHRDVKPANVLLDEHGEAYLSDFGVLKVFDGDRTKFTTIGHTVGTPEYMAPEQAQGHLVDPAADVYGLGMVAYQLLTGTIPFDAPTLGALMVQVVATPPPSPRTLRPDLPEAAGTVLLRALAKIPADRYPSAGAFAHALARTLRPPKPAIPTPLLASIPPPSATVSGIHEFRPADSSDESAARGRKDRWRAGPRRSRRRALPVVISALVLVALTSAALLLTIRPFDAAPLRVAAGDAPAEATKLVATLTASAAQNATPSATATPQPTATRTPTPARPTAAAAKVPNVVGSYNGYVKLTSDGNTPNEFTLTITAQTSHGFSGSASVVGNVSNIYNATLDSPGNVSFELRFSNGDRARFTGTLNGETLSGQVEDDTYGDGTWSASR